MATANELLLDATIRHQIKLLRYAHGQAESAAALLMEADDELVKKLQGMNTPDSERRLREMLAEVRRTRMAMAEAVGEQIRKDMPELAETEANWELAAIEASSPVVLQLAGVPANTLKALVGRPINGVPLDNWLGTMAAGDVSRIEQQIRLGVVQGETMDQLVRRIRGTKANKYADGVTAITRRNAETIARTAVNHVSNAARHETWNANADIIRGVRWVATLDGRTSPVCRGRDGEVYPMNEGPRPPAHPGCRSTTTPVLAGDQIVGERPFVRDSRTREVREKDFRAEAEAEAGAEGWKNMTATERNALAKDRRAKWTAENIGQAPSTTNYDSWLRKQPREFQDEVLGKAKADVFRGGTTLDKFVDEKGKPYTIDQLRAEVSGDKLHVVQPGVGMKAKSLLQQGLSNQEVVDAIKAEYPDAATTTASVASYKVELKKAGLLDLPQMKAPAGGLKQAKAVADVVSNLEGALPPGVKHHIGGQWATVVEDLDGSPGAYGYYQAGKGVLLSGKKLSAISVQQAQQVAAHELGHLLHKQHDVQVSQTVLKTAVGDLSPDAKKLYGYYLASTDELTAEVLAQALSPSPLTSQGLSALEFNQVFAPSINQAKQLLAGKFPTPHPDVKPPLPGGPTAPFEVAGKHTSPYSLAKALLQQNLPDDQVYAAIVAEFPATKVLGKDYIKVYKEMMEEDGVVVLNKASGPTVVAKAIPDVAPVPPKPEVMAAAPSAAAAPSTTTLSGAQLAAKGVELFEQGVLDSKQVADALAKLYPQNVDSIKVANVASWKTNWKKKFPGKYAEAEQLSKGAVKKAEETGPTKLPELYGKDLGNVSWGALNKVKSYLAGGGDVPGAEGILKGIFSSYGSAYNPKGAADIIELAQYELATAKSAAKPYLNSINQPDHGKQAAMAAAEAQAKQVAAKAAQMEAAKNKGKVEVDENNLSASEKTALEKIKSWILQDLYLESPTYYLDIVKTYAGNTSKAESLLKLADKLMLADDMIDKSILGKVLKDAEANAGAKGQVDLTPARPASTPREGIPPPPRFTSQQRRAAIGRYSQLSPSVAESINAKQRKLGLEELTVEEASAIRIYTGSDFKRLNNPLREGKYASDLALQAFVEAAQQGMAKMPKFTGRVSRGLTLQGRELEDALTVYQPGAVVEDAAFVSSSTGERAAFSGNIYMKIESRNGVYVDEFSKHRGEREVLFRPGTRFRVTSVAKDGNAHIITMEEVE